MQTNNPNPNPKGNEPKTNKPKGNEPKGNKTSENVPAGGEALNVWAFHDAFGFPRGPLPPAYEVWPALDKAFRAMLDEALDVDKAEELAVSVSCTYLHDLLAKHNKKIDAARNRLKRKQPGE
jgi:hypothetical protein